MAKNLGDILLEQGVIDREALDRALELQGRRLGEILIEENLADPIAIAKALKFQARLTTSKSAQREHKLPIQIHELEAVIEKLNQVEKTLLEKDQAVTAVASLSMIRGRIESMLLVPVESLFKPLQSLVEQLSQTLKKPVEFESDSFELLLDRSVANELSSMAIHLIRNAIDHGIENAEQRRKLNKPEVGKIKSTVALGSGKLILTISDDGAGIDLENVYQKATQKGLCAKSRAETTDEELIKILFTPGFSTAAKSGMVSGRGVGLDVVESGALRLGGTVSLKTKKGSGSEFLISVPLTFAKFSVVPLSLGNLWVTIPATDASNIRSADTEFNTCASLFGLSPALAKVLVTLKDGSTWGFDEVGTPEQAFVHGATQFTQSFRGVVGETRLSSGQSALLLDLAAFQP